MPKYNVSWNERYIVSATVEAENEAEARDICTEMSDDELDNKEFVEYEDGSWYFEETN